MQKITPFLWFNDNAEKAVNFYTGIFRNSRIDKVSRYGDAGPGPKGSVMALSFNLNGMDFIALNGGPQFTFSPAVSFLVNCGSQAEIDELWEKLSEAGVKRECGWLTDKFGLCWQIVPSVLGEMLSDKDTERSQQVMKAMLQMTKLDIARLTQAYEKQPV
jgi:predicted 3-demethylubiquinone-9 3-methyltransferase (glyoxalase superfamily)